MERILIAEDDPVSRQLLQINLKNWGYDVIAVANGLEALDVLEREDHPPFAILDWMMPELDGLEVCKRFRALNSSRYCYIILLTAKSFVEDIVTGLESGADDYVIKPFNKTVLKARVNVGCRVVQLERERSEQLKIIKKSNDKVIEDLKSASLIQKSLLPNELPIIENFKFAWLSQPSNLLGGDMLNLKKIDNGKLIFYIFDVSGHGAKAALLSVSIQFYLNKIIHNLSSSKLLTDTELVLKIVNTLSSHYSSLLTDTGQYFTLLLGVIDPSNRECNYIRAGHLQPIFFSKGKCSSLQDVSSYPIGMFDENEFFINNVTFFYGDKLYIYTDGLIEVANKDEEEFSATRLEKLLERENEEKFELEKVVEEVSHWDVNHEFNDDITILEISSI